MTVMMNTARAHNKKPPVQSWFANETVLLMIYEQFQSASSVSPMESVQITMFKFILGCFFGGFWFCVVASSLHA